MKELLDAMESRIKSPVLGYFTISVLLVNWAPIYYLFASEVGAAKSIGYFYENTSIWSLLILPAIISSCLAVGYPWINLIFLKLLTRPTHLKNQIRAEAEHQDLLHKSSLEKIRAKIAADRQNEVIERAKIDSKVEGIDNPVIKEKAKSEIEKLRLKEKYQNIQSTISQDAQTLLKEASKDSNGVIMISKAIGHFDITTNGKSFIGKKGAREEAKWTSALEELEIEGYVSREDVDGQLFKVTNLGYQTSDILQSIS